MPDSHLARIHAVLPGLQAQHPGRDWLLLFVGAERSEAWLCAPAAQSPSRHMLPLGYAQLAAQHMPNSAINGSQVERVIETVEDVIMPLSRQWPAATAQRTLAASAAPLPALAGLLPERDDMFYSLEELEQLFNRFADAAMGSRSAAVVLAPAEAACLTLLRECMHHWGCHSLVLLPAQAEV